MSEVFTTRHEFYRVGLWRVRVFYRMSTHAREYWLNVQAREAVRIAMDIEVDQEEIDLTFETSFAGDGGPGDAEPST